MRKKLDTRFPASRIKKIMQADEDVGKIAMATPVLVSKALELFLQDLCDRTYDITLQKGVKTMGSLHLKQCVHSFNVFDFLKDIVSKVPDLGGSDAGGDDKSSKRRKAAADGGNNSDGDLKRSKTEIIAGQNSSSNSGRGRGRVRGRGRPKGSGRRVESTRYDKFEDDPGTSPQHDDDNKPEDLKSPDENKNTIVGDSKPPVRNFDLNLELNKSEDASGEHHEPKHEEFEGLPMSDINKMVIDPLKLSLLNDRVDEEEEDYDNEEG
ncbi:DNA polymerase epsilon subunit C-like isoform X2 [Asparagus officinalis]|uniref:DNA polymerase epsilon subunit C-like isoform X2 n=1 Tax=Asparagus officinalis TaxID=4686 RepID=UPI00098E739C|nr:DNA polymerase epsilon subunit C-like isoform X2 [Asparagus officinalis]